ncbi:hypothetical protein E2C01_084125 [Portunus trituberculatus]|uniref:Uncharacterized protein n=1 Tax=Portunus trituberculatus TaxID=210409 RepID=A0A5B7J8D3_PORTR|nr:hypothetical protein [Portunus trituberculatus]
MKIGPHLAYEVQNRGNILTGRHVLLIILTRPGCGKRVANWHGNQKTLAYPTAPRHRNWLASPNRSLLNKWKADWHRLTWVHMVQTTKRKGMAARHGSRMADASLNILERSLAARNGRPMAVANPTPVNSAKSTQGTVHCLTCPRN